MGGLGAGGGFATTLGGAARPALARCPRTPASRLGPVDGALVVHAIAAPLIAAAVTASYRHWFGDTRPAPTAVAFTAVPMVLDAIVIAPFAEHSYAMFTSAIRTWIPFALIFASSYVTGRLMSGPWRAAGTERA